MAKKLKAVDQSADEEHAAHPRKSQPQKTSHAKRSVSKIHKKRYKVSKKSKVENGLRKKVRSIKKKDKKRVSNANDKLLDYWVLYPRLCASLKSETFGNLKEMSIRDDVKENVKEVIRRMGEGKASELEDLWKAVHEREGHLYVKRACLIQKQAEAVADSLRRALCGGVVKEGGGINAELENEALVDDNAAGS